MKKFEWLQPISEEIFKKKYMINDETSEDEVFIGIAKEIASVEKGKKNIKKWTNKFYDEISSGRLIPAGRILANARPEARMPYYNNCYTIAVEDSIDKIYDSLKEDANISSTGGGVGMNFSNLRPKNAPLSKGGFSSGVISFMKVFNESAKIIQTGGSRRAAHIGILNIDHPEIENFITCKQGDENNALTQFNISVGITDAFMDAVKEDTDWDLQFEGKVYKTVKAKYLYELMTKNAYIHNEPGIFNIDTVHKEANSHYLYKIVQTNPCFTGEMKIKTEDGYIPFIELNKRNPNPILISPEGNKAEGRVWSNGIKDIVKIKFYPKEIKDIKCTPDHLFKLIDGSSCQAKDLKRKQIMPDLNNKTILNKKFIQYGFLQGNGNLTRLKSKKHLGLEANIGENDQDIFSLFEIKKEKKRSFYLSGFNEKLNELKFDASILPKRIFPMTYHSWGIIDKQSFLNGMYSANGSIIKNYRIAYKTTSIELAKQLKETLYDDFNIDSYITTNKTKKVKFSNGIYLCKESYDININRYTEILKFYQKIGFWHKYKKESLKKLVIFKSPKIRTVKKTEKEEVFDFTINTEDHWGIVNGFIVHNCAEQSLPEYGVCDLGAVNFSKFVINPFTPEAKVDWDSLSQTIKTGIRFLDNVLDATKYPLEKIKKRALEERRIGLGFTGYADMLVMLGIVYGSEKSKEFTDGLGEFFKNVAYMESISLSKEKGKFKLFNKKILESGFIKRMHPEIKKDIKRYGLRNIAILTIAPTGTSSFSIGQNCSSGIEPIFALQYDRAIRTGFGDETKTETVYDYAWLKYLDYLKPVNSVQMDEGYETPKAFATTFDIDIYDAIDIQSIWQKHIDASISKCVAKGTLISTNKGLIPIEKLSDENYKKEGTFGSLNDEYYTIDENGDKQKITSHYYNGKKEGIKLTFSNGFSLEGSFVHKLKTEIGWKSFENLNVGDSVLYRKAENIIENDYIAIKKLNSKNHIKRKFPTIIDEDFAKFIGMLIADGRVSENGISIVEKDEDVNKEVSRLFNVLFNKETIKIDKRNGVRSHELYSRYISKFFKEFIGTNALTKKVPNEILISKKAVQVAFINGLTLDGYLTQNKTLVIYDGYSKNVAFSVAQMVSAMGMKYWIGSKKVKNGKLSNISWGIRVYLNERIFTPEEKHKKEYNIIDSKHDNILFPEELIDKYSILPKTNSKDYFKRRDLRRSFRNNSFVGKSLIERNNLLEKVDENLIEVKITKKEVIDEVELYDIEVENSHSYLIGGIINHNTINLPTGTSYETYKELFQYAYDNELKGFTTFNPEGSMEGILSVGKKERKGSLVERRSFNAIKRPNELPCDIYEMTVDKIKHIALVGIYEDFPYEIFATPNVDHEFDFEKHKKGKIIKKGKGKYSLVIENGEDKVYIEDIAKSFNSSYGTLGRLISMSLRHRTPLQFIVDQLTKDKGFVTFEKLVSRILKKYIKEGEKVKTSNICPECGNTELVFQEGCLACKQCGWMKCS